MTKIKTFKVRGSRVCAFPLDMLRYDSCWPTTSEDVGKIELSLDRVARREVEQKTVTVELSYVGIEPTVGRWESFGWRVET